MKAVCNKKDCVLALGAESEGIFAVYNNGNIFISDNFGDLLEESNFLKYKKAVLCCLKRYEKKLEAIVTDLHPLYKTTIFGEELAKKYKARHIKVQHHMAHIFSTAGDKILTFCHSESAGRWMRNLSRMRDSARASLPDRQACEILRFAQNNRSIIPNTFYGIAMDGTGFGLDGNIWGGEVFQIKNIKIKMKNDNVKSKINKIQNIEITRIGSLEEQIMIGGDLAVREPARMVIAILAKLKTKNLKPTGSKNDIYNFVSKFYTKNEFELLYNQMGQNFNCQKTTSSGRVLDAAAVLLGFAGNERKYKHEAVKKLEENSSKPYTDLKPQISFSVIASSPSTGGERGNPADIAINKRLLRRYAPRNDKRWILQTTPLFEYLIKNIHKEKKRLAATAQLYLTKGFYEIVKKNLNTKYQIPNTIFAAGGMTNNKIISEYLEKQGVYLSKKIPRGDKGIAIGQMVYYLLSKK